MNKGTIRNKKGKNVLIRETYLSIQKIEVSFDKLIGQKIVKELHDPYLANAGFLTASRIIRYYYEPLQKSIDSVKESITIKSTIKNNGIPFFIPSTIDNKIIFVMFPNLIINPFSRDINYTSWLFNVDTLKPLITTSILDVKIRCVINVHEYLYTYLFPEHCPDRMSKCVIKTLQEYKDA